MWSHSNNDVVGKLDTDLPKILIRPKILFAEDSLVHQVLIKYILQNDLELNDRLDLTVA